MPRLERSDRKRGQLTAAGMGLSVLLLGTLGARSPSCCEVTISTSGGGTSSTADAASPPPIGWPCSATKENASEAASAAKAGLKVLGALVEVEKVPELGFPPGQPVSGSLGVPFCVFTLPLDKVAGYTPAEPVRPLLVERHALYPVEVEGTARSSLTVEPLKGVWQATTFGGAGSIGRYTQLRAGLASGSNRPLQDYVVVVVPGLDISFIASEDNGLVTFHSAESVPELGLSEDGKSFDARELLMGLKGAAADLVKTLDLKPKPPVQ